MSGDAGSSWAVHFPGNLRWSNAMQIVKGMAPYGAVAMDEVDRIGRRLNARAGEADLDRAWQEEWSAMADRLAKIADTAAAEGRAITAGHNYMRAGNYYYSGERFVPPGEEKMAIYHKALRCYRAGLERRHPNIERVDRLVKTIAAQKGEKSAVLDETSALVDARLEINRKKA